MNSFSKEDLHWASVFFRAIIGSLFLGAALIKMNDGVAGTLDFYRETFRTTMVPGFIVSIHGALIIFVELAVAIWILTGYKLNLAWKAAGILMLTLALGMLLAGKYETAAHNYFYVFLCIGGLLVSPFDRWTLKKTI